LRRKKNLKMIKHESKNLRKKSRNSRHFWTPEELAQGISTGASGCPIILS
jgi:hypothetical protein